MKISFTLKKYLFLKDLQQSTTRSGIVPPGGVNQATIQSESIYGQSMDPADVPEKISQAIRTLPAEQMYSLMKEMKEVITVWTSYLKVNSCYS